MENIISDKPNVPVDTVPVQKVDAGLDAIAAKMAAMRNIAERNRPQQPEQMTAGSSEVATEESPAAPDRADSIVNDDDMVESVKPEADELFDNDSQGNEEVDAPEEVSSADSSPVDIIDFLEFAEENPNAKFRFKRNGKEIEIDAKKAAAILGQGAAVSEDARKLKIDRADFDEYINNKRSETEGLILAMEFTIQPQIQKAYDEIVRVQEYQNTFRLQLEQTQDPAQRAKIMANMQQNERYLEQQGQLVNHYKPRIDEFYKMRGDQVKGIIETTRKSFSDKELRNEYVYNELRDRLSKNWAGARRQLVPGVDNIDLIASDEHILSLLRDGLKYRDRPKAKQAGASLAALTQKRSGSSISGVKNQFADLQEKARAGDRNAQDNLLVAKMNALRAQRGGR